MVRKIMYYMNSYCDVKIAEEDYSCREDEEEERQQRRQERNRMDSEQRQRQTRYRKSIFHRYGPFDIRLHGHDRYHYVGAGFLHPYFFL